MYCNKEGFSHGSKFKTYQYRKIRLQIFDICAKMLDKCVKSQKNFLYIVLFCKVKLSKMVSIKTNKIKNQRHFSSLTFHYKQLCFWFHEDSSTLKVFKIYFVLFSRPIQNVARRRAQCFVSALKKRQSRF